MDVLDSAELEREQQHFDTAWQHREKARATTASIPHAAANSGAAAHMRKYARSRLEQLGSEEKVAFGRIDHESGDTFYIGHHTIRDGDTGEVLVVNWRADAAIPYQEASYADPLGLRRKRTFQCTGNLIDRFDDQIFAEIAAAVEALETRLPPEDVPDALLLQDLAKARTGEMRHIVETIQAAQSTLMRAPIDQVLVIQGGPGTGKTALALHRVSWLLYNHRESLSPEDVLVIGPNPTFTRYIHAVLPSLGDDNVNQRDIGKLAPPVQRGRVESDDVIRLKGQARMADLLARALEQRTGVAEGQETVEIQAGSRPLRLARDELAPVLESVWATAGTYADRRKILRERLAQLLDERRDAGPRATRQRQVDLLLDRLWPLPTAAAFLRDLLGSRDRLIAAAGDEFTAAEVARLQRRPAEKLSEETWGAADLPLLDEVESLINGVAVRFGHIVVDEAQDLSPMQLRSIARRSATGSMTVVGDIAQSTGLWSRDGWDDVLEHLPAELPHVVRDLRFGYRVPRQIYEMAARLLPIAAPLAEPPEVVRDGPSEPHLHRVDAEQRATKVVEVASTHAGKGRFVGIVCPDSCRTEVEQALNADGVTWSNGRNGELGKSINLVSPGEAKGLEFDAVVVVEPEDVITTDVRGHRLLYIALTRTTTYLDVVHAGDPLPLHTGNSIGPAAKDSALAVAATVAAPALASAPPTATNKLSERVISMLANEIAAQIREASPEGLWGPVVRRVAELLGQAAPAPTPQDTQHA